MDTFSCCFGEGRLVWGRHTTLSQGQPRCSIANHLPEPGAATVVHAQSWLRTWATCRGHRGQQRSIPGQSEPRFFCGGPYTSEQLVNAVRLGQEQSNQDNLDTTATNALRYLYPRDWTQRLAALLPDNRRVPRQQTLMRARRRLDSAACLLRRQWYSTTGPTFRYVGIDASPQRASLEVLVTVERVIVQSVVRQWRSGQPRPFAVEQRRMPVSVLGHGRCGLAEKVQATLHQTWLEYGPSLAQVRAANRDVRQIVSDMGTEFGIADYPDVVHQCLAMGQTPGHPAHAQSLPALPGQPATSSPTSFLYPLALAVPGTQHLLDNALRDILHRLPFWKTWQAQSKVVCQWLASQGHREFLQARLPTAGPDTASLRTALQRAPDRFAAWRWQTLGNVTRDLERMETAVRAAMVTVSRAEDLNTRDSVSARAFLDATQDPDFWAKARGLRQLTEPIRKLSGWAKGCDCHEQEMLQGKKDIQCVWKGCRGPSFAARLRQFQEELVSLRSRAIDGQTPGLSSRDVIRCLTHLMAYVRLKFQWVYEAPYTVWQLDSPEVAKEFLDTHDALVAAGGTPHRVVAHFAGVASALRNALETHANGQGMSEALRTEIASYQFCTLDDTWVEAAHRDISCIVKKKTNVDISTVFATMRLKQNLSFLDSLAQDTQVLFHHILVPKWKSIARPPCKLQPRRVQDCPWLQVQQVLTKVYRLGAESQYNWSAHLQAFRLALPPLAPAGGAVPVSPITRLKLEFLHILMETKPGQLYSAPLVSSEAVARAWAYGPGADGLAILEAGGERQFFEVVLAEVQRKKLVKTTATQRMKELACPVMLQNYTSWPSGDEVVVYPVGEPQVMDFLSAAEWPVLRMSLRLWDSGPCDTHGVHPVIRGHLGQRHRLGLPQGASAGGDPVGQVGGAGLASTTRQATGAAVPHLGGQPWAACDVNSRANRQQVIPAMLGLPP